MSNQLRIIYAGTPDFSVAALQALIASPHEVVAVYTQPDRPAGRGRDLQMSPVKQEALRHDIAVYQPVTLRDEAAQQELRSLDADLMVVTAYGLLLPVEVLQAPRLGCINIHASLLPRWRGAAPIQRAIQAGDKKTGITIMQMDQGLDTGDILAVAECEIAADDTGSSLHDKLMSLGAEILISALPGIAANTVKAVKQDDDHACYASKLNKAEARVDWSQPAVEIERLIRAFNAWPVAFCEYDKKGKPSKLRLWQAEVLAGAQAVASADPGQVIAESVSGIDVLTGEGVLRIKELQAEGKRRMTTADFLNANSLLDQILK
ncbi:MAG: methionyl-tRNA formyltransferase [Gammaproteobacteria bacterium]|nr:methionyl-tRNA formyltransferase [Gammaproteobacteria bacterium]NNJ51472.1 methionyl-tRNA formyltransferase [Gammaproteobacteria bacterium]